MADLHWICEQCKAINSRSLDYYRERSEASGAVFTDDYIDTCDRCHRGVGDAREQPQASLVERLERENSALKLMLIKKGFCPFGVVADGKPMNTCILGFPGCACADELMAELMETPEGEPVAGFEEEGEE